MSRLSSSSSSSLTSLAANGFSASQLPPPAPMMRAPSLSVGAAPAAGVSAVVQKIPSGPPGSPQGSFTLFLRVHSARNLATSAQGVYCKLYVGETAMVNGTAQTSLANLLYQDNSGESAPAQTHRVFRTHVMSGPQKEHPVWNQKFEVNIRDPLSEILSVRVKGQQVIFSPGIGACAIQLSQLALEDAVDQWFPIYKGQRSVGQIRLQLLLSESEPPVAVPVPAPVGQYQQRPPPQQQQYQQYQQRPGVPPSPLQRPAVPPSPPQHQRAAVPPPSSYANASQAPRPAPTMSVAEILKRRDQWQQAPPPQAATENQDAVRAEEEEAWRKKQDHMQQREQELERERRIKEEMEEKMRELKLEYQRQKQQEEQEEQNQREAEQLQQQNQPQKEAQSDASSQQDDIYSEQYWQQQSSATTVDSERDNNQDEKLVRAVLGSQRNRATLDSGDFRLLHDSQRSDDDRTIDYYVSDEESGTPPASFAAQQTGKQRTGTVQRTISSVVHDALPSSDSSDATSSDGDAGRSSRQRKLLVKGGKSARQVGKNKTPKRSSSSSSSDSDVDKSRRHSKKSAKHSKHKKGSRKQDDKRAAVNDVDAAYAPVGIPASPPKAFPVPQPKPGTLEYDLYYPVGTGSMLETPVESTGVPTATPAASASTPPDFAALMNVAVAQQQASMAEFMKAISASASSTAAPLYGMSPAGVDITAQIAAQQKQYQAQIQETMIKMMAESNPHLARAMAALQPQQQRNSMSVPVPEYSGAEAAAVASNSAESSDDSSPSSEDERLQRRKLKKLKKKMKKMKRKVKRREAKAKRAVEGGVGEDSDSDSDSDSSSSSSSSSSSEEERRKRKAKKKAKEKMRARSENDALRRSQQSTSGKYPQPETNAKLSPAANASAPVPNQCRGRIESMSPHEIQQQQPGMSLGDVLSATSVISDVASIASSIQSIVGGGDTGGSVDALGGTAGLAQFFGATDFGDGLNIGDVIGQIATDGAGDSAADIAEYFF